MDCSSVAQRPVAWPRSAPPAPLPRLPRVTLDLPERCTSRCISCDFWRHGRRDMDIEPLHLAMPGLRELGTRVVLVSGGEPLLHPQWADIAALLRPQGMRLWLLTAGLALAKQAA